MRYKNYTTLINFTYIKALYYFRKVKYFTKELLLNNQNKAILIN